MHRPRRPIVRRLLPFASLLLLLSVGGVTARQSALLDRSPAVGGAQVVTQGIATMPEREVVWRVVERTALPRGEAKPGRTRLPSKKSAAAPVNA
jgi:hypothetical protein